MKRMTLLLFVGSVLSQVAERQSFVISLRGIDSSRQLLEQIYDKAESIGFKFGSLFKEEDEQPLVEINGENTDQPGSEDAHSELQESDGAVSDSHSYLASGSTGAQKTDTPAASKSPQTAAAKKPVPKKTQSAGKAKSKSPAASKTSAAKSSAAKSAKSSVARSMKSSVSRSSVAKSSTKKLSTALKSSISRSLRSSAAKSMTSSASRMSAGLSSSRAARSSRLGSSVNAMQSQSASRRAGSSALSSLSTAVSSSVMASSASSIMASSSSAMASSIDFAANSKIEQISQLAQSTIDSIVSGSSCKKVDDILVYKDGDSYRDFSGKLAMTMQNGQIVDKTGVFAGKDCTCKKDEIPAKGQMCNPGIYQGKNVDKNLCKQQGELMEKLVASGASSAGVPMSSMAGEMPSNTSSVGGSVASAVSMGSASVPEVFSASSAYGALQTQPALSTLGNTETPVVAPPQSAVPTQTPMSAEYSQPPIVFKAIRLKYDLACNESRTSRSSKITEYRTETVTIVDVKRLPPETMLKTITRLVVPDTVSKTLTRILRPDTVTVTEKPDTVIKFAQPRTITSISVKVQDAVTVTKVRDVKPETCTKTETVAIPMREPAVREKRRRRREESDEAVSKPPGKGIECMPDCPCENKGNCDNPCMEIKCEIVYE